MENGSEGANASVLFGLAGFVVRAQTMHDGEWWLAVETTTMRAACPSCGVFGVGNGRRRVLVRDLPVAGTPVIVVWSKRTWRCREDLCERGSWSECCDQIAVRASLPRSSEATSKSTWSQSFLDCGLHRSPASVRRPTLDDRTDANPFGHRDDSRGSSA